MVRRGSQDPAWSKRWGWHKLANCQLFPITDLAQSFYAYAKARTVAWDHSELYLLTNDCIFSSEVVLGLCTRNEFINIRLILI